MTDLICVFSRRIQLNLQKLLTGIIFINLIVLWSFSNKFISRIWQHCVNFHTFSELPQYIPILYSRTLITLYHTLFEPTDVEISAKPFETPYSKAIKFITPNLNELKFIASFLNIQKPPTDSSHTKIKEAALLAQELANYVDTVIVTLGSDGVLIARKALATDPLLKYEKRAQIYVRHYPGEIIKDFVNVSGAGDCLASGIVVAMLSGWSEAECLSVGFSAARCSLFSNAAVPEKMFDIEQSSTARTSALFKNIF